jgi:hypothetical protein
MPLTEGLAGVHESSAVVHDLCSPTLRRVEAASTNWAIRPFPIGILTQLGNCLAEEAAFYLPFTGYNSREKRQPRCGFKPYPQANQAMTSSRAIIQLIMAWWRTLRGADWVHSIVQSNLALHATYIVPADALEMNIQGI